MSGRMAPRQQRRHHMGLLQTQQLVSIRLQNSKRDGVRHHPMEHHSNLRHRPGVSWDNGGERSWLIDMRAPLPASSAVSRCTLQPGCCASPAGVISLEACAARPPPLLRPPLLRPPLLADPTPGLLAPLGSSASEPKAAKLLVSLTTLLLVGCTCRCTRLDKLLLPTHGSTECVADGRKLSAAHMWFAQLSIVCNCLSMSTFSDSEGAARGPLLRSVSADSSPGLNSNASVSAALLLSMK